RGRRARLPQPRRLPVPAGVRLLPPGGPGEGRRSPAPGGGRGPGQRERGQGGRDPQDDALSMAFSGLKKLFSGLARTREGIVETLQSLVGERPVDEAALEELEAALL